MAKFAPFDWRLKDLVAKLTCDIALLRNFATDSPDKSSICKLCERLCESSRDIFLQLHPVGSQPAEQLAESIVELKVAAELILKFEAIAPIIREYSVNISRRCDEIVTRAGVLVDEIFVPAAALARAV